MIDPKKSWEPLSEALPVDVFPCSNEEYFPPPPNARQLAISALAEAETERLRRKFSMSRRDFVRTAAATTIGFWAIDAVGAGRFGNYGWAHNTATTAACDLEWAGRKGLETLRRLPGEFVFDVQTHHVDPDAVWRVSNPAFHALFAFYWPQASPLTGGRFAIRPDGSLRGGGGGEVDPVENLSRFHYLKELYLDSATAMTVLSCVPTSPDTSNPLPLAEAALTVRTVNSLARSQRAVMHAFVMPNRGSGGSLTPKMKPRYLEDEMDLMMARARQYPDILRGWKTYPAWGDVPYSSGWYFDTDPGMRFLDQVREVSRRVPSVPPVVACHKGFALPGFDQRAATPRDIGKAAKQYRDVRFLIYHSGYDTGDVQRPYAGDAKARSDVNKVDALIKSLRENDYDATKFVKRGRKFGNVPNVYAELGSVWRNVMYDPDQAAHLLGKLITYVGPQRIVWGTDSLWYGSPQAEIVGLRRFEFTERGKELYGLPYGLEGDVKDPTKKARRPERTIRNAILGRNAARAYEIDPDERRRRIDCDDVETLREQGYLTRMGTERESAPLAGNVAPGPRTRREVVESMLGSPWSP